ncbi:MAG: hypothetical protein WBB00_22300 [Mycobacterium sp.]
MNTLEVIHRRPPIVAKTQLTFKQILEASKGIEQVPIVQAKPYRINRSVKICERLCGRVKLAIEESRFDHINMASTGKYIAPVAMPIATRPAVTGEDAVYKSVTIRNH